MRAVAKALPSFFFRSKGIDCISADTINTDLRNNCLFLAHIIEQVIQTSLSDNNHAIDTARLRNILFSSKSAQEKLETILHPLIMENIELQLSLLPIQDYCIIEIPLLFEADLLSHIDRALLVTANRGKLAERIRDRSQLTSNEAAAILDAQLEDKYKFSGSKDIVFNSSSPQAFHDCLDNLYPSHFI